MWIGIVLIVLMPILIRIYMLMPIQIRILYLMFQIELTRHQLPAFVTELVLDPVPEFIITYISIFKNFSFLVTSVWEGRFPTGMPGL